MRQIPCRQRLTHQVNTIRIDPELLRQRLDELKHECRVRREHVGFGRAPDILSRRLRSDDECRDVGTAWQMLANRRVPAVLPPEICLSIVVTQPTSTMQVHDQWQWAPASGLVRSEKTIRQARASSACRFLARSHQWRPVPATVAATRTTSIVTRQGTNLTVIGRSPWLHAFSTRSILQPSLSANRPRPLGTSRMSAPF